MLNSTTYRLWVIAHRGGCALRPENTLAAFWNAIDLGVDMVEADVKLTKDGKPVLLHDDSLERTTNGRGNVKDFTLQELRQLDVGSHFDPKYHTETIPTLEDLFRLCRSRVKILLDLKAGEQYHHQIVRLITAYRMEFDVVMGVRTLNTFKEIKRLNPAIRVLSFGYPIDVAYEILEVGADIIRLWGNWVTPDHVERVRTMGKAVWVMAGEPTVEGAGRTTPEELRWYRKLGVNGVILDDPRIALQVNREP